MEVVVANANGEGCLCDFQASGACTSSATAQVRRPTPVSSHLAMRGADMRGLCGDRARRPVPGCARLESLEERRRWRQ